MKGLGRKREMNWLLKKSSVKELLGGNPGERGVGGICASKGNGGGKSISRGGERAERGKTPMGLEGFMTVVLDLGKRTLGRGERRRGWERNLGEVVETATAPWRSQTKNIRLVPEWLERAGKREGGGGTAIRQRLQMVLVEKWGDT